MPADIYDSKGKKVGSIVEYVPQSCSSVFGAIGCIAAPFALALILFVSQFIFPTVVPVVEGIDEVCRWDIPADIVFRPFSVVISKNMYLPLIAAAFVLVLTRHRIPLWLRIVFGYVFFLAITYCAEAVDFMWTVQMKQADQPAIRSMIENSIYFGNYKNPLARVEEIDKGRWYISSFCVGGLYFVVSIVLTTIINLRRKRTDDFVVE